MAVDDYVSACKEIGLDVPQALTEPYEIVFELDIQSLLMIYEGIFTKSGLENTQKFRKRFRPQFNRIIPEEFAFHYETQQLNREIGRFRPDDEVSISVKLHGTSLVIGNVLTLKPRWGGLYARFFNYLPSFLQLTRPGYDVVYSSRTVIKNKYYNAKVGSGYYDEDIWREYYKLLMPWIPGSVHPRARTTKQIKRAPLSKSFESMYDVCKLGIHNIFL